MCTPRYTLQAYAGRKTRYTCPACGKPHKFTRFLDTLTGDLLPERFGRCDREVECGYSLRPYDKRASGQSYADEIRQNQAPVSNHWQYQKLTPSVIGIIPEDIVQKSKARYDQNTFVQMLQRLFGWGEAYELVQRFEIGSSSFWPGATVFWQRDEVGRMRGGQVVLFDEHGHTAKRELSDGTTRRCTNWIHKALEKTCQKQGQPVPQWLREYLRPEIAKSPCLYGLSQLADVPVGQPIGITEAPKTAILATPYMPAFVWLAVGSLSNLTAERLQPIKNRRIVLWPDASTNGRAYDLWASKAAELRKQGFEIVVSDFLETTTTDQQKAEGYDLADLILSNHAGYPPSWDA